MILEKYFYFWLILIGCSSNVIATRVTLQDNGYEGLLLAINPSVPEDPQLINKLKV